MALWTLVLMVETVACYSTSNLRGSFGTMEIGGGWGEL